MTASQPDIIIAGPADDELDPYSEITEAERIAARPGVSPLDGLRDAIQKPAERKPLLTLRIPQRPAVSLTFDPNFTADDRKVWRNRAKERATGNRAARRRALTGDDTPIDPFIFACLALAHTNIGVRWSGQEARIDGEALTLRDERLWQMMGQVDPEAAIRWLYGNDAHVEATAGEILLASGLDDEIEEVGPTTAS